jgi:hypothetical protein
MIQTAWIMPGIYPNKVNRIFSQNAPARPTCRKTPKGGSKIAINILSKSIITLLFYLYGL